MRQKNEFREESIQRGKYINPFVTVTVDKRRMRRVEVFGAVSNPGSYEIPTNDCDLAGAISAAGGLTDNADTIVEIRRPKPPQSSIRPVAYEQSNVPQPIPENCVGNSIAIDLTQPKDDLREQLDLKDGSIVMVREKKPRSVFVTGMVNSPQQVEIPVNSDLRLLDAVTIAGGRSTPLAQKIKIIRMLDGMAAPVYIVSSYSDAKRQGAANLRLADGDVVSVEETPGLLAIETVRSLLNFGVGASVPLN